MKLAAPMLALGLTACVSAADHYASAVDQTFDSAKPIAAVSGCLALKYATAPITTPGGETTFLLNNMQHVTLAIVSLTAVGSGTRMEMRRAGNKVGLLGNWRSCG